MTNKLEELDNLQAAKNLGWAPMDLEDMDWYNEELSVVSYYDWKKANTQWVLDMKGNLAENLRRKYKSFSYYAGSNMNGRVEWKNNDMY